MKLIGITGGIGSGKTVVTNCFRAMGYPCYDSDAEMKSLYHRDSLLCEALQQAFGEGIFSQGKLNRTALASIVFQDSDKLQRLNQLTHPACARDFLSWAQRQNAEIVFFESALLFSANLPLNFDLTIAVTAPEAIRVERVCRRNACQAEEVRLRMKHQLSDEEICAKADYIIHNGEHDAVLPQVLSILQTINHTIIGN